MTKWPHIDQSRDEVSVLNAPFTLRSLKQSFYFSADEYTLFHATFSKLVESLHTILQCAVRKCHSSKPPDNHPTTKQQQQVK